MKVFISCPMKDRTKEEIEATISYMKERAKRELKGDVTFVNTIVEEKPPYETNKEAIWYLGKSIEVLSQCDAIVCFKALKQEYNGCIIERSIAERYGLKVIYLELE